MGEIAPLLAAESTPIAMEEDGIDGNATPILLVMGHGLETDDEDMVGSWEVSDTDGQDNLICEVYSPPGVVETVVVGGWSRGFQLACPHQTPPQARLRTLTELRTGVWPLLVLTHIRTYFSIVMALNVGRMDDRKRARMRLRFAMTVAKVEANSRRRSLFEHPTLPTLGRSLCAGGQGYDRS